MKKLFLILAILLIVVPFVVFSQTEVVYPSVPGVASPQEFMGEARSQEDILPLFMTYIFHLLLIVSVIVALAVIVYGGVLYFFSAGDPEKRRTAKSWILSAFQGSLLIFTSYALLFTLDSQLVLFQQRDLDDTDRRLDKVDLTWEIKNRYFQIPFGLLIEDAILNDVAKNKLYDVLEENYKTEKYADYVEEGSKQLLMIVESCPEEEPCCDQASLGEIPPIEPEPRETKDLERPAMNSLGSGQGGPFSPAPPGAPAGGGTIGPQMSREAISKIQEEGVFPVDCDRSSYTSLYGLRERPGDPGTEDFHRGVDISCSTGDPIRATHGGKVVRSDNRGDAGNAVGVLHSTNDSYYLMFYFHLDSRSVREGDTVGAGNKIGECGSTGYSTGPHLHYEVRESNEEGERGDSIDPIKNGFLPEEVPCNTALPLDRSNLSFSQRLYSASLFNPFIGNVYASGGYEYRRFCLPLWSLHCPSSDGWTKASWHRCTSLGDGFRSLCGITVVTHGTICCKRPKVPEEEPDRTTRTREDCERAGGTVTSYCQDEYKAGRVVVSRGGVSLYYWCCITDKDDPDDDDDDDDDEEDNGKSIDPSCRWMTLDDCRSAPGCETAQSIKCEGDPEIPPGTGMVCCCCDTHPDDDDDDPLECPSDDWRRVRESSCDPLPPNLPDHVQCQTITDEETGAAICCCRGDEALEEERCPDGLVETPEEPCPLEEGCEVVSVDSDDWWNFGGEEICCCPDDMYECPEDTEEQDVPCEDMGMMTESEYTDPETGETTYCCIDPDGLCEENFGEGWMHVGDMECPEELYKRCCQDLELEEGVICCCPPEDQQFCIEEGCFVVINAECPEGFETTGQQTKNGDTLTCCCPECPPCPEINPPIQEKIAEIEEYMEYLNYHLEMLLLTKEPIKEDLYQLYKAIMIKSLNHRHIFNYNSFILERRYFEREEVVIETDTETSQIGPYSWDWTRWIENILYRIEIDGEVIERNDPATFFLRRPAADKAIEDALKLAQEAKQAGIQEVGRDLDFGETSSSLMLQRVSSFIDNFFSHLPIKEIFAQNKLQELEKCLREHGITDKSELSPAEFEEYLKICGIDESDLADLRIFSPADYMKCGMEIPIGEVFELTWDHLIELLDKIDEYVEKGREMLAQQAEMNELARPCECPCEGDAGCPSDGCGECVLTCDLDAIREAHEKVLETRKEMIMIAAEIELLTYGHFNTPTEDVCDPLNEDIRSEEEKNICQGGGEKFITKHELITRKLNYSRYSFDECTTRPEYFEDVLEGRRAGKITFFGPLAEEEGLERYTKTKVDGHVVNTSDFNWFCCSDSQSAD